MVALPQGTAYSHDGSAVLIGVPYWVLALISWGCGVVCLGFFGMYQLLSFQPVADEWSWEWGLYMAWSFFLTCAEMKYELLTIVSRYFYLHFVVLMPN